MSNHRILVVMDREVIAAHDSSVAIIEEALLRDVAVDVCDTDDLCFVVEGASAMVRRVRCAGIAGMALDRARCERLAGYGAILYRKDPPFTSRALEATLLLEHVRGSALLINDPRGLRDANEKLFALRFAGYSPPTAVLRDRAMIWEFCRAHDGRCVLKPLDGCGGRGVFALRDGDPNAEVIIETATDEGRRRVIVQAWLPVCEHGDKRIFLLDGEPVGALLRMPAGGDSRANLRTGAEARATTLSAREQEIAHVVGRGCRALGLAFVGLDVIAGHLTEVNVTSPTGLRELEQVGSGRLQTQILDWIGARLGVRACLVV
jgi:glutathione synthase